MFFAELAVFAKLNPVRSGLLVLACCVVPLLALSACHCDFISHFQPPVVSVFYKKKETLLKHNIN
jgi:hypothetical protein